MQAQGQQTGAAGAQGAQSPEGASQDRCQIGGWDHPDLGLQPKREGGVCKDCLAGKCHHLQDKVKLLPAHRPSTPAHPPVASSSHRCVHGHTACTRAMIPAHAHTCPTATAAPPAQPPACQQGFPVFHPKNLTELQRIRASLPSPSIWLEPCCPPSLLRVVNCSRPGV